MSAIRGMFSGIETTPAAMTQTPRLGEGDFELECIELRAFKSKKPPFAPFFVGDFKVLSTTNDAHPIGSSASWLVNMTHSPALGNIKQFAVSMVPDLTEDEVTEEAMEAMLGEDQPCKGLKVGASCQVVKTKAGYDFPKVSFRTASEA
jgi:hypothetical protein